MHQSHAHQASHLQLNGQGRLKHFLSTEGLSRELLTEILDRAESFLDGNGGIRNVPLLAGRTVMNLFFEPSTRTRTTFEVAAKRLSADVLNIDISKSSTSKGETLRDMLWNLEAMTADVFVVRHGLSGAPHFIASQVTPQIAVSIEAINVLSEPVRTYGRDERQLFFAQELKPRVLVGARYRF